MNLLAATGFGTEECCPLLCKLKTPQLADHCIMNKGWGNGVVNRTGPNASAEVIAFSTRILMKLFELKEEVSFFCDINMAAGMVVLQKLMKALVNSGDVMMNVCFCKVEKM